MCLSRATTLSPSNSSTRRSTHALDRTNSQSVLLRREPPAGARPTAASGRAARCAPRSPARPRPAWEPRRCRRSLRAARRERSSPRSAHARGGFRDRRLPLVRAEPDCCARHARLRRDRAGEPTRRRLARSRTGNGERVRCRHGGRHRAGGVQAACPRRARARLRRGRSRMHSRRSQLPAPDRLDSRRPARCSRTARCRCFALRCSAASA